MRRFAFSKAAIALLAISVFAIFGKSPVLAQPVFPPQDAWNVPIASAPVDPMSATYIAYAAAHATSYAGVVTGPNLHIWNATWCFMVPKIGQPTIAISQKVSWHSFPTPWPVPLPPRIQADDDAHMIVLDLWNQKLYESYDTSWIPGDGTNKTNGTDTTIPQTLMGTISAYGGWVFDLRQANAWLPAGTASATASGLPAYPGLIRYREVNDGRISHALFFSVPAGVVQRYGFVRPASDTDQAGDPQSVDTVDALPYGAHLRLKASFDTSKWRGKEAVTVANALKEFGCYVGDTGGYFALQQSVGAWNYYDLRQLGDLAITDFDVVSPPDGTSLMRVPGH
jgi:hypothetical protein